MRLWSVLIAAPSQPGTRANGVGAAVAPALIPAVSRRSWPKPGTVGE